MPKAEERSFRYQTRTKENVKERANMRGGNFDSYIQAKYKMWTPRDGKNLIRILPPTWENAKHYGYDVYLNYGIGGDNQTYLSLYKMKGDKDDPIFEAKRAAEAEGDKDLAKALSFRQRILYWIIDRNAEDEGPQIWPAPFTFDKDLANICYDEDTREVFLIDSPDEGRDLRFYKEGQGLKTRYEASKMKLLPASYLHEDQDVNDDWLEFIAKAPLPDCLQYYSAEHIAGAFDGVARVDKPEDEEDRPARNGRARTTDREEPAPRGRGRDAEPAPRQRARTRPADEGQETEAPRERSRTRLSDREEPATRQRTRDEPPFEGSRRRTTAADDGRVADEADADGEPEAEAAPRERTGRGESVRERLRNREPDPEVDPEPEAEADPPPRSRRAAPDDSPPARRRTSR